MASRRKFELSSKMKRRDFSLSLERGFRGTSCPRWWRKKYKKQDKAIVHRHIMKVSRGLEDDKSLPGNHRHVGSWDWW